MKKFSLLMLVILYSLQCFSQTPNTWSRKNDMGPAKPNLLTARVEAVGFSIGTKGYLGTGSNSTNKFSDFWEFDPINNAWTQKANFPGGPRASAVGFSIGNKGYVGTGINALNNQTNDFWEYNPATNTWTQKASFGGTARKGAVGFSISNKGYIGTGNDSTGNKNDFWEYNPTTNSWIAKAIYPGGGITEGAGFSVNGVGYIGTGNVAKSFYQYEPFSNTWTSKAPYPGLGITEVIGFSIGNKGYFATGKRNANGISGDIYEYDPSANTWTKQIADLSQPRYGGTGFSIAGRGYITTGWDFDSGYRNDTWEFKPNVAQWHIWTQRVNLGAKPRRNATAFSVGNKAYVGGGFNGKFSSEFWEYDPVTDSWTQKASIPGKPREKAFGFGIGNKGYLGGGVDSAGFLYKTFYEYNPFSNTWSKKSSIYWGSAEPSLGFSIGSKGYLYGGLYFQEYNPATDTWTLKADFPTMARSGAVAFSVGNKGYFGLGFRNGSNMVDLWEYDPATDTWLQKANFPASNRSNAVSFRLGNKGYLALGTSGSSSSSHSLEMWEYNPATNTWLMKADFPGIRRTGAIGFGIGSKGYVGLGFEYQGGNFLADLYEYNPSVSPSFKDIAVTSISGLPLNGCGLSSQQAITISVANLSGQPEHHIPVSLAVNGTPLTPNPVVFPDTIAPNSVADLTFTTTANLSASGSYRIKPAVLVTGDNNPVNDTATFTITNKLLSSLPYYDFELPGFDLASFRIKNNFYNYVHHATSAGNLSSGALATTLSQAALPINMDITGNIWKDYADRIGGAYLCFNPAGGSPSDSLWLTFDLKQEIHYEPVNTNFRVTVNGQQVGPTYNPTATNSLNYRHYKIDLHQYLTASSIEIGFESLLNRRYFNNTNPINFLDNIRVVRRLKETTGIAETISGNNFSVYPNPSSGRITIMVPGQDKYVMQIEDLTGKVLKMQQVQKGKNEIELPNKHKGIYLVKLISENRILVKKLILN